MMGVILNHVSDYFVLSDCKYKVFVFICEALGEFAVPAFLMLSGAFLIENSKNKNYKYFYLKSFNKIGIHIIVFSVFYFVWTYVLQIHSGLNYAESLRTPIKYVLTGWAGHPLWYVYTLVGIYSLMPLLSYLYYNYGNLKIYHLFACTFIVWSFVSMYFEGATLSWTISKIFGFLGYVLLGSEIKCFLENRSNNLIGITAIIAGFLIYVIEYLLLYRVVINGGDYYTKCFNSLFSPLSLISVIFIFVGICKLKIRFRKFKFPLTVKYSFFVYLIHKFVLDVLYILADRIGLVSDCRICIPVMVFVTLALSMVGSLVYLKLFNIVIKPKLPAV